MLSLKNARQQWAARQLQNAPFDTVPGGWSRSLGGVDPYLALHARCGCSRADVDAALADGRLWVVPGVRGCIWLVPAADMPLALAVSEAQAKKGMLRELNKLGCDEQTVRALAEAAHAHLSTHGPMTPVALGTALPQVVRFGDAGRKAGVTSNLPGALRLLEWSGRVRRRAKGGVLDTQAYSWEACALALDGPTEPVEQAIALLDRFLDWAAPASLAEFVAWSRLGKTVARQAVEALSPEQVEVEGLGPCLTRAPAPAVQGTFLLPAQDNLQSLRLNPGLLVDPLYHQVEVHTMGKLTATIGASKWIFQRLLVRDGEIVGLWAWDAVPGQVVADEFAPRSPGDARFADEVEPKMKTMADFITHQLGGRAKAVSIDSDAAQRRRVELVRSLRAPPQTG